MNISPEVLASVKTGDLTSLCSAVFEYTLTAVRPQLKHRENKLKACSLFRLEDMGDRVKVVNCYGFTTTQVELVKVNRKVQVWEGCVDKQGMIIRKPEGTGDYLVLKSSSTEVSNKLRLG